MSDDDLKWIKCPCGCGVSIGVPHSAWQGRIDGYRRALDAAEAAVVYLRDERRMGGLAPALAAIRALKEKP